MKTYHVKINVDDAKLFADSCQDNIKNDIDLACQSKEQDGYVKISENLARNIAKDLESHQTWQVKEALYRMDYQMALSIPGEMRYPRINFYPEGVSLMGTRDPDEYMNLS